MFKKHSVQTKNVNRSETARLSVVDAAGVGVGLWFTYIFATFYLFLTVATVTHVDLFFDSPLTLPLINISLSLRGFFIVAPAMVLGLHAYLLLHLLFLAAKLGELNRVIEVDLDQVGMEHPIRSRLPSNIFVQLLAGAKEVQRGSTGILLRLIVFVTIQVLPPVLLLFFQVSYLPAQDEAVVWWQRFLFTIDIVLLWLFLPKILAVEQRRFRSALWRKARMPLAAAVSLVLLLFSVVIASFPEEPFQAQARKLVALPTNNGGTTPSWQPITSLLFEGDIDPLTKASSSMWSNRLILTRWDEVKSAGGRALAPWKSSTFRGRPFNRMYMADAALVGADFTGAQLDDVLIEDSDLSQSTFACAKTVLMKRDTEACSLLRRAKLMSVNLSKSNLQGVHLTEAFISRVNFAGSKLWGARAQNAIFTNDTNLQGASLFGANLAGAHFIICNLRGTDFGDATLRGAILYNAAADGAKFSKARLEGSEIALISLVGADFYDAHLDGASMSDLSLAGADFWEAYFIATRMDNANVWRSDFRPRQLQHSSLTRITSNTPPDSSRCPDQHLVDGKCDWPSALRESVALGSLQLSLVRREELAKNASRVLDPSLHFLNREGSESWDQAIAKNSSVEAQLVAIAEIYRSIACKGEDARHVTYALTDTFHKRDVRIPKGLLLSGILESEKCPDAARTPEMIERIAAYKRYYKEIFGEKLLSDETR